MDNIFHIMASRLGGATKHSFNCEKKHQFHRIIKPETPTTLGNGNLGHEIECQSSIELIHPIPGMDSWVDLDHQIWECLKGCLGQNWRIRRKKSNDWWCFARSTPSWRKYFKFVASIESAVVFALLVQGSKLCSCLPHLGRERAKFEIWGGLRTNLGKIILAQTKKLLLKMQALGNRQLHWEHHLNQISGLLKEILPFVGVLLPSLSTAKTVDILLRLGFGCRIPHGIISNSGEYGGSLVAQIEIRNLVIISIAPPSQEICSRLIKWESIPELWSPWVKVEPNAFVFIAIRRLIGRRFDQIVQPLHILGPSWIYDDDKILMIYYNHLQAMAYTILKICPHSFMFLQ